MGYLSKSQILGSTDSSFAEVDVPEWGGVVRVRAISGGDRDAFEASLQKSKGGVDLRNLRAKLVVLCAVDDKGDRLFTDAEIPSLAAKAAKPLDRVFDVCLSHNGFKQSDLEELQKNS